MYKYKSCMWRRLRNIKLRRQNLLSPGQKIRLLPPQSDERHWHWPDSQDRAQLPFTLYFPIFFLAIQDSTLFEFSLYSLFYKCAVLIFFSLPAGRFSSGRPGRRPNMIENGEAVARVDLRQVSAWLLEPEVWRLS